MKDLPHLVREDDTYRGCVIPKGTIVRTLSVVYAYASHHPPFSLGNRKYLVHAPRRDTVSKRIRVQARAIRKSLGGNEPEDEPPELCIRFW